jgi:predicted dienelactone hydrolase
LAGAQLDWTALTEFFKSSEGKDEINIPEMPGLINLIDNPEIKEGFAAAPSLHDKRIKSVFAMSPAAGQGFPTKQNFSEVSIPTYIVTVGGDKIAPPNTNAAHYAKLIPRAGYALIDEQAGHYVFLNEAKESLKSQAPMFFSDRAGVNRREVHEKVLAVAFEHFRKTLKK